MATNFASIHLSLKKNQEGPRTPNKKKCVPLPHPTLWSLGPSLPLIFLPGAGLSQKRGRERPIRKWGMDKYPDNEYAKVNDMAYDG